MIPLGKEVQDKVTGFVGIVISRHQHITGCDRYTVAAVDMEHFEFDEDRLTIRGDGVCKEFGIENNVRKVK